MVPLPGMQRVYDAATVLVAGSADQLRPTRIPFRFAVLRHHSRMSTPRAS